MDTPMRLGESIVHTDDESHRIILPDVLTDEVLDNWIDIEGDHLPPQYKRSTHQRIFVNRDLRMEKIKYIGFDMDYTLAVYKSPEYEQLSYRLAVERLIAMGYPSSIASLSYDPVFSARGVFLDKSRGNLLKADRFGYVLRGTHGRRVLTHAEIKEAYPAMQIHSDEITSRFYLLNTLFNVVDACLYSDLVDLFEKTGSPDSNQSSSEQQQGIHSADFDLSYTNLFNDVRSAIDYVHQRGTLKAQTLKDIERYVDRDERTSVLLDRLRKRGFKVFLLTNSEFEYTTRLMSYMLDGYNTEYPDWKSYFDYIIVGANKPLFFGEGTTLREVDENNGSLKVGATKQFEKGRIYNGGSMSIFSQLTGAKGAEVLYVGDHIFADIITSKKRHGWRNLIVIRELSSEIDTWIKQQKTYNHLRNLEYIRAKLYQGMDSSTSEPPNVAPLTKRMAETVEAMNQSYNQFFGSLFQDGSKHTFFGMQVQRYADLYTADFRNLLHYPLFYYFAAWPTLLPHQFLGQQDEGEE